MILLQPSKSWSFRCMTLCLARHAWMVRSLAWFCTKFFIHHSCLHWFPSFWQTSFICAVSVVNVRLCVSHKSSPSFILLWHIVLEWKFPICTWKMLFHLSLARLVADLEYCCLTALLCCSPLLSPLQAYKVLLMLMSLHISMAMCFEQV